MKATRLTVVTPSIYNLSDGVSQVARELSSECFRQGVLLEVLAAASRFEVSQEFTAMHFPLSVFPIRGPSNFKYASGMRTALMHSNSEVFHAHGLWRYPSIVAGSVGRRRKIPVILSTHDDLSGWSWEHKYFEKELAWLVYQQRSIQMATLLHATSESEAEVLRAKGLGQPIAILPNGVELSSYESHQTPTKTPLIALFLSRIHPKKGLLNLIEAWAKVRPQGWKLLIAGPDFKGHKAQAEHAVDVARLTDLVDFIGPVYGDAKMKLYVEASLFILPTFSENFGLVVGEALACGVPVIVTKGAPWQEVEAENCGWWPEVGVESLAAALDAATRLNPDTLRDMGARGRALIERKYTWPRIAKQMIEVYNWVGGSGNKPGCIHTL